MRCAGKGRSRSNRHPERTRAASSAQTRRGGPRRVFQTGRPDRYEFNAQFRTRFEENGFLCSGTSPDKRLVEFIELTDHPFWVGTQAHPEFKSRPDRAHPLFIGLINAALNYRESSLNTSSTSQR
jgi:CTP synthase (UTP-ammonia lyase)